MWPAVRRSMRCGGSVGSRRSGHPPPAEQRPELGATLARQHSSSRLTTDPRLSDTAPRSDVSGESASRARDESVATSRDRMPCATCPACVGRTGRQAASAASSAAIDEQLRGGDRCGAPRVGASRSVGRRRRVTGVLLERRAATAASAAGVRRRLARVASVAGRHRRPAAVAVDTAASALRGVVRPRLASVQAAGRMNGGGRGQCLRSRARTPVSRRPASAPEQCRRKTLRRSRHRRRS